MANPLAAVGIFIGLIVGFLIYRYKKKWWLGAIGFILTLIAIATPFHCIIIPTLLGIYINKLLYKYVKINWASFLISLAGIFLIALILSGTGKLYIQTKAEGPMGLGEAIGTGIAMALAYALFILAGIISYIIATSTTSIQRWIKNSKLKKAKKIRKT